jgi:hypothetical protein
VYCGVQVSGSSSIVDPTLFASRSFYPRGAHSSSGGGVYGGVQVSGSSSSSI